MFGERLVLAGKRKEDLEKILRELRLPLEVVMSFYQLGKDLKLTELQLVVSKDQWTLVVMKKYNLRRLRSRLSQVAPHVHVMSTREWIEENFPER